MLRILKIWAPCLLGTIRGPDSTPLSPSPLSVPSRPPVQQRTHVPDRPEEQLIQDQQRLASDKPLTISEVQTIKKQLLQAGALTEEAKRFLSDVEQHISRGGTPTPEQRGGIRLIIQNVLDRLHGDKAPRERIEAFLTSDNPEPGLQKYRGDVNRLLPAEAQSLLDQYREKLDQHPVMMQMLKQRASDRADHKTFLTGSDSSQTTQSVTAPVSTTTTPTSMYRYQANIPPLPPVRNDGLLHQLGALDFSSIALAILSGVQGSNFSPTTEAFSRMFSGDISLPEEPGRQVEQQIGPKSPSDKDSTSSLPTTPRTPVVSNEEEQDEETSEAMEHLETYLKSDATDGSRYRGDVNRLTPDQARTLFDKYQGQLQEGKHVAMLRMLEQRARGETFVTGSSPPVEPPPVPPVVDTVPPPPPLHPQTGPTRSQTTESTGGLTPEVLQAQLKKLKKVEPTPSPRVVTTESPQPTTPQPLTLATSPGSDGKPASGMGIIHADGNQYEFNTMEKQISVRRADGTQLSFDLRLWGQVTDARGTRNMTSEDKQALHRLLAEMQEQVRATGASEKETADALHLIGMLDRRIDELPPPPSKTPPEPTPFERMRDAITGTDAFRRAMERHSKETEDDEEWD